MPMNFDKLLIMRALAGSEEDRDNNFRQIGDAGIEKHFFGDTSFFDFAVDFKGKYQNYPSQEVMKKHFNIGEIVAEDPLTYYVDQIIGNYSLKLLSTSLLRAQKFYDNKDPQGGAAYLNEKAKEILDLSVKTEDLIYTKSVEERQDLYIERINNSGPTGILSGFKSIDNATFGWQPGEFNMLVARTGQMKTWTLCWMVKAALEQGKTVLLATVEMGLLQIARRLDALLTQTCFESIRAGKFLNDDVSEQFFERLLSLKNLPGEIVIIGGVSFDVNFLRAKIEQYRPDVLYVDGFYLMADTKGAGAHWEKMLNISGDLKRLAGTYKIPTTATTQLTVKKAGGKQAKGSKGDEDESDIMYSQAMAQNADNVIALGRQYDDVLEEYTNRLWLKLVKLREGEPVKTQIEYDFTAMTVKEIVDILDDREEFPLTSDDKDNKEISLDW
jgi:replicative DNA helicase